MPLGPVVLSNSGAGNTGEIIPSPAAVGKVMEWKEVPPNWQSNAQEVPHKIDNIVIQWCGEVAKYFYKLTQVVAKDATNNITSDHCPRMFMILVSV